MQRRQGELKRKRAEEEEKRREQAAALVVRKVIQRVRIATPDNFESLRIELEQVQQEQLEKMGSQALKVLQEAEKGIMQAQERVDEILEKRAAEDREKFEAEMKAKEEETNVEFLRQTASDEVAEAERKVTEATELAEPVFHGIDALPPESVPEAVKTVDEAVEAAQSELDKTSNSLVCKKESMGKSDLALQALRDDFRALFARLAKCRRTCATLKEKSTKSKGKIDRAVTTVNKEKDQRSLFDQYDSDKDGKLDRDDIVTFTKAEYQFEVSEATIDKIFKAIASGAGVPYEQFRCLRSMVAIAKSESKAREKNEGGAKSLPEPLVCG